MTWKQCGLGQNFCARFVRNPYTFCSHNLEDLPMPMLGHVATTCAHTSKLQLGEYKKNSYKYKNNEIEVHVGMAGQKRIKEIHRDNHVHYTSIAFFLSSYMGAT